MYIIFKYVYVHNYTMKQLLKVVKRHSISKGYEIGKIFLPKEWIDKRVRVKLLEVEGE